MDFNGRCSVIVLITTVDSVCKAKTRFNTTTVCLRQVCKACDTYTPPHQLQLQHQRSTKEERHLNYQNVGLEIRMGELGPPILSFHGHMPVD